MDMLVRHFRINETGMRRIREDARVLFRQVTGQVASV